MVVHQINLERNSIILYGAGYAGLHFCDLLLRADIKPMLFYDIDKNKIGKTWHGIKIKDIKRENNQIRDNNILVIVCLLRNDELFISIRRTLEEKGFKKIVHMQEIQIIEQYRYLFEKQNLILYADKMKIAESKAKISAIRDFLDDDGKRTYDEIFNYIDSDFKSDINHFPIEEQYWAYDLFAENNDEVVYDCGAFDGSVMREFVRGGRSFKKYYAIEPDKANADRIFSEFNHKICVIRKAISDKYEVVSMRNYMNMNSVIINEGDFDVETIRLDDIPDSPTFIKIDVEGYEERVLEGGRKLIEKCRPIIACAMYHSVEQLWNVPQILIEMTNNYCYTIRSYMNINETIFYAIPNERKR